MSNHTDAELIKMTLNGETDAFGELVTRYQDAVYATALHRTGSFTDAQDVAQEAFIEAYKNLHKLREYVKFPSWLHTITVYQCNHWRRRYKKTTSIDELDSAQIMEISNDRIRPPDEVFERRELQQTVLDTISSLPEKVGEVVTMYYIDGLSYNEIANFLSISKTTVKGRLQMGRKQLKEELITMVEGTLKQNRPDEQFSGKVLAEIIEQVKKAREQNAHDEVMQLCEKALEALENLKTTEEHKLTKIDVLNWQSDELMKWFGKPENALKNFQHAEKISAELKDQEGQAKWLMMQAVALSRMGKYQEMTKPVQKAHKIYGELGQTRSQIVCDAILDLVNILPEGWERVDIPAEVHTGHSVHRYSLTSTAEAITYIDEEPRKSKAWCEKSMPYQMWRGWATSRTATLIARVGKQNQILLFPIKVGSSWKETLKKTRYDRYEETLSSTRSIEAIDDTVVVPAGRFENCLRVKTVIPEPADADFSQGMKTFIRRTTCGTRTMWFAPSVGLVKYRHDDDTGCSCTVQLVEYRIENSEQEDYFPLSTGNRWKYERYVDLYQTKETESYRVVAKEDETIHIACAMYSELLNDTEQLEYFQVWLEHEKASDDMRGQIWMLHRLSDVYARLGNLDTALETYHQLNELMEKMKDVKLQIDLLLGNIYEMPVELVAERAERALKLAEEINDLERQKEGLRVMTDFYLRHGKYTQALKAVQRALPIVISFGDIEEQTLVEAEIDLANALIADPDGGLAIKGGKRSLSHAEVSDSEIVCNSEGGILPIAHGKRPYPPIHDDGFWADAPLLKAPAKEGETWSGSCRDGLVERIVEAVNETVSVSAGEFDHCVRVKTTMRLRTANEGSPQADKIYNISKGFREGEKWMWFAPGVGIVKAEHHHANGKRTVIELTDYQVKENDSSYFPITIGNQWIYEWHDEDGEFLFKEKDRVICKHEGKFYIACSGYTTNVEEY